MSNETFLFYGKPILKCENIVEIVQNVLERWQRPLNPNYFRWLRMIREQIYSFLEQIFAPLKHGYNKKSSKITQPDSMVNYTNLWHT